MLKALSRHVRVPERLTNIVGEGLATALVREPDPRSWPPQELERTIEHPWAFHQIQALGEELTIVEVGGADPGLRSTLALAGHRVIAVGGGSPDAPAEEGAVVALSGTVDIPAGSVDVLVLIQGFEPLPEAAVAGVVAQGRRVLRAGGHVVLTTSAGADPVAQLAAFDAELVAEDLVQRHGFTTPAAGGIIERARPSVRDLAHCVVGRKR
ncbi:hypothetical protein [Baekduia sp. Peel2402]|uniref:hypothetical protein n=1 Tax=Baekduia sp. Peel2402 TaxID=3458296 RepID=UPI00403E78AD